MKILSQYISIPNFLKRFTLLQIGKLHIRFHMIKSYDTTTLVHNHPFNYMSIILWGGYQETRIKNDTIETRNLDMGSIAFCHHTTFHRIDKLFKPKTITLFFAYGVYPWRARNLSKKYRANGVYQRTVCGKLLWCKSITGIWYIGHESKLVATIEHRHSIFQAD